jgi:hypothetical protein
MEDIMESMLDAWWNSKNGGLYIQGEPSHISHFSKISDYKVQV